MDEFQYQLYLNKIESLKGTKKPLKDLALEIHHISDKANTLSDKMQIMYKKYILFRTIERYSTAINPLIKAIEAWISYNENNLLISEYINIEQFKNILPYMQGHICFYPTCLSDLDVINDKVSYLTEGQSYTIAKHHIIEISGFLNLEYALYLYVKAFFGESPLLSRLSKDIDKSLSIEKEINSQFNSLTLIKQQYEKEQHEHTN